MHGYTWLGIETEWTLWAIERGIGALAADQYLAIARGAEQWLKEQCNETLGEVIGDELAIYLRTATQARLAPAETRKAIDAFQHFLVDIGQDAHAYLGLDVPWACDVEPPSDLDPDEPSWRAQAEG